MRPHRHARKVIKPPSAVRILAVIALAAAVYIVPQALMPLYRVAIKAPEPYTMGAPITTRIVATVASRWPPSVELALVQGDVAARIGSFATLHSDESFIITIGPDILRKFAPGPAILRATIHGRSRWYGLEEMTNQDQRITLAK